MIVASWRTSNLLGTHHVVLPCGPNGKDLDAVPVASSRASSLTYIVLKLTRRTIIGIVSNILVTRLRWNFGDCDDKTCQTMSLDFVMVSQYWS